MCVVCTVYLCMAVLFIQIKYDDDDDDESVVCALQ